MLPAGFERLLLGHAVAIARSDVAAGIRRSLVKADGTRSTLHEYAARHPGARLLRGRDAAYAVALPETSFRVVIRHNRHGGLLARFTGDRFVSPTRAPYELEMSLALAQLGVPTPEVVAYALYPPGGLLQRSDVCSREVAGSRDLADVLTGDGPAERGAALAATADLVGLLSAAGARHHDLNAKNVLLSQEKAYVLDVDRMTLRQDGLTALTANLARLARSLRKWRDQFGARVSDGDISDLEARARQGLRRH
jgi:tRNA A-37 threonylcarbamoyl transferase component Bud32